MRVVILAGALATCVVFAAAVQDPDDGPHELGESAGVGMEAYQQAFVGALTARGKTLHQAQRLFRERRQLGEGKEEAVEPDPSDSINEIKKKGMAEAIKILQLENQKSKLIAENTMNAEAIPNADVARKIMTPQEYHDYHKEIDNDDLVKKNEKLINDERAKLTAEMEKDLNGKFKQDAEQELREASQAEESKVDSKLDAGKKGN